jgi:5-methylcytosine-specific restriction enzyme subunit McrC
VFISLFADRLLAEARRGLPRQYRAHEADLRALRGRLDVVRQFTVHAVRPDRLACRFDALDADVPLMQVMKACVLLLARHARWAATQRKLAELRFLLADVADVPRAALPWGGVRIDRASRRWRALLELARLLLGSRWQETHAAARAPEGITLLFPMNLLFERYIAVQLRRALAGTELEVVPQGGGEYCLGPWNGGAPVVADSHPTRPDILIRRADGGVAAVLDTKWKHVGAGIAPADLYQMMAYARLYACSRLILLYPAPPAQVVTDLHPHGIPPTPDRLDVATIALERGTAEIQNCLRRLVISAEPPDPSQP